MQNSDSSSTGGGSTTAPSKAVFDVAVIGGGIAGASAAAALAKTHSVVLCEQEAELAYHTTSRSAAVYLETEAGEIFQRLNLAAASFLKADHAELDAPLFEPLPVIDIGTDAQASELQEREARYRPITPSVRFLDRDETLERVPHANPELITCGLVEETAGTIDVMALHQLFIRRARAANAEILRNAKVTAIDSSNTNAARFTIQTAAGEIKANTIINAAGAWGDEVAKIAGAKPLGLQPYRRTAFAARLNPNAQPSNSEDWPFIHSAIPELGCYFKPEAGQQMLCSLGEETPMGPCDVRHDEIDVAMAIDRINTLTTLQLRSVATAWAGLRTFCSDRVPTWGFDDQLEGFYWCVGQGGWGIVTSPSAAMIIEHDFNNVPLNAELTKLNFDLNWVRPQRFRS